MALKAKKRVSVYLLLFAQYGKYESNLYFPEIIKFQHSLFSYVNIYDEPSVPNLDRTLYVPTLNVLYIILFMHTTSGTQ